MKKRIIKMITAAVIITAAGLLYYLINRLTGFAIPCPMNFITGLHCPGCGISRMFISLFSLDFAQAFRYNAGILIAFPFMLILAVTIIIRYIKSGTLMLTKWQNVLAVFLIVFFIAFGVLRNIPYFDFLAPPSL